MKGDRFNNQAMSLPYGNLAVHDSGATLDAAAIGEVVDLMVLPPGARLMDARLINAGLGSSTTLTLGYRFPGGEGTDDAAGLLASASSASAGRRDTAAAPIQFSAPVIITATVGGAAATGRIDAVVEYVDGGTL
ncbi:hypothetical protein [uncultured Gilvimarinus sp.]|uniref:hypothetical protein n=1 Tax=uncultured Gilvimarinus sp. TaxID=1689143 RepID=UPI0030EB6FDC|tara:strand:+ start:3816 stop:4217 length:402 start_codon:yes stop_codon:yes gene_type:complete